MPERPSRRGRAEAVRLDRPRAVADAAHEIMAGRPAMLQPW